MPIRTSYNPSLAVAAPATPRELDTKGNTVQVLGPNQTLSGVSDGFDCEKYNAVCVQVVASGTNPSATLIVEGAAEQGALYLTVSDPQAIQIVTASLSFDVMVGSRWARIRLASITGTYPAGTGFTVWVTPYISPGQPNVTANHVGAGQTAYNTGVGFWLESKDSTPRMSIGDPAGAHLLWDGATLAIAGAITTTSGAITGLLSIAAAGSLIAGGDAVTLDSLGIEITVVEGVAASTRAYTFNTADLVCVAGVYTWLSTGCPSVLLESDGDAINQPSYLTLRSIASSGKAAELNIYAVSSGSPTARIQVVTSPAYPAGLKAQVNLSGDIVKIDGDLSVGEYPAASGAFRLENAVWLTARNGVNTGDVNIARMNASDLVEIGGGIGALVPWTGFNPTLQQGANVSTSVSRARYCIIGHTAIVQVRLQANAAGTAWSEIGIVGLPAALTAAGYTNQLLIGQYRYEDYGTSVTSGGVMMDVPGRYLFLLPTSTAYLGASALALALYDSMEINCLYEV